MSLPKENQISIEMLHNRGFTVSRTENSFSRVGFDMAHEQILTLRQKAV